MRILDIDLDFFLDKIAYDNRSDGTRLSEDEFKPSSEEEVREFLETKCGLSTSRRIPGKYIIHHHEAFYWWRELIRSERLAKPFEVVHVDAHADLGAGAFSYTKCYIGFDLLHQSLVERETPQEDGMKFNAGNFLAVAIACRWINKLVYVMHPENKGLEDCEDWLFSEYGDDFWTLSLPKLKKPKNTFPGMTLTVLEREPPVEFHIAVGDRLDDKGDFDFVVLCQSPGFTPESSDALIPVIKEYMDLEA